MVLIPPGPARRHPVDLLLFGHHYLSYKAGLAVVGAVVMDATGAIVDPAPVSKETCDSAACAFRSACSEVTLCPVLLPCRAANTAMAAKAAGAAGNHPRTGDDFRRGRAKDEA